MAPMWPDSGTGSSFLESAETYEFNEASYVWKMSQAACAPS
jgi:hypothetical protein